MSAAVFKPEIALPKSEVRLLGALSLAIDGRELHQLPRKADALLALLALQPGRPMARETVADFLWTNRAPEQARHSLRQTLLVLRRSLPVVTQRDLDGSIACHDQRSSICRWPMSGRTSSIPGRLLLDENPVTPPASVPVVAVPVFVVPR
jgi:hypothetical protein